MRVVALDSLLEGHRAAVPPGAIFCQTDLGDRAQIENVFSQHKIDAVMNFAGEAFNVGNSRGFSILEVIDVAERITGRKIPRKLGPRRPGDPAVLVASKEKLRHALGWEASHSSLEEIIQSAWTWKQKHPNGYADSGPSRISRRGYSG